MRKNKKFLTFMVAASLCAVQFACPMSMVGFAAEQTIYTGECGAEGDNITWTYDTETKTMTFSGTGAMQQYVSLDMSTKDPEWVCNGYSEIYDAEKVIFEEGITDIGELTPYVFGKNSGWRSLEIPESVQNISLEYIQKDLLTYYTKYGSYFYYKVGYSVYQQGKGTLVSTGIAENPVYPTKGTSETGLTWDFDYETRTLTVSGTDSWEDSYLLSGLYPILVISNNLILDRDFVSPANPDTSDTPSQNSYLKNLLLEDNGVKNVYCYKDSSFSDTYEAAISDYDVRFPSANNPFYGTCKYIDDGTSILCGDINLNGKVDLIDAIYLNKYFAGQLGLTDMQKSVSDCNGDGDVNDADATTLMEFLILQIPSLPHQG